MEKLQLIENFLDNRSFRIPVEDLDVARNELGLLISSIKDECAEDIRQGVQYYLKYQKSLGMWEDKNEYQKGVQVTCENIQQLIENDFINKVE